MRYDEKLKQQGLQVDERNLFTVVQIKNNAGFWFGAIGAGVASIYKTRFISIKGSTLYLYKQEKKALKQVNQFQLSELKKFQVKNGFLGLEKVLKFEVIDYKETFIASGRNAKNLKAMAALINLK